MTSSKGVFVIIIIGLDSRHVGKDVGCIRKDAGCVQMTCPSYGSSR